MAIIHRTAVPGDLERLCALLDDEFITAKGRTLSLARRFPSTFCAANAGNIFLAEEGGKIVSAFAAKPFDWLWQGRAWKGAMVGAVYTHPHRRGEGNAGKLLAWGVQKLKGAGIQFTVLWTTQQKYYARLGWVAADAGLLGSGIGKDFDDENESAALPEYIKSMPLALSDERKIDMLRRRYLDGLVCRGPLDYHQMPVPAEEVDVLFVMNGREPSGFALVGRKGDTGIVYEMMGDDAAFSVLWPALRRRYGALMINDHAGGCSYRWLSQQTGVRWEEKKLAMWLPLSGEPGIEQMSQWYIPYFDRI